MPANDEDQALKKMLETQRSLGRLPSEAKKAAPKAPTAAAPTTAAPTAAPVTTLPENTSGMADPLGDWVRGHFNRPVGRPPTDEEMDWQQRMGRGVAHGLARFGTGLGDIVHRYVPGMNDVAAAIPEPAKEKYRELREFGKTPSKSMAESIGEFGGEALPTAFLPVGRAAGMVERALTPAPVFQRGLGFTTQVAPQLSRAGKAAVAGTRAAEAATAGAVGGAVADPENPGQGAAIGAASGVVPPGIAGLLRGRVGQIIGEHGLRHSLGALAAHTLAHHGVPWEMATWAWPTVSWLRSPIGLRLYRHGPNIVDGTGRLIGTIPSGAAGTAASKAMGGKPPKSYYEQEYGK